MACSRPEGGAPLPTLATRGEALEPVAAHQTSPTGVASSADELLFLLSSPNVTLIVLGGKRAAGARLGGWDGWAMHGKWVR